MEPKTDFGKLIKDIRLRLGPQHTQTEMAQATGISRPMVNQMEVKGKLPSDGVLKKIAEAYGRGREEKEYLLRQLRETALLDRHPESATLLEKPRPEETRPLPPGMRQKIKALLETGSLERFDCARAAQCSLRDLDSLLAGDIPVLPGAVIQLAHLIKADPDECLVRAGFTPPSISKVLREHPDIALALRSVESMTDDEARMVTTVIQSVLDMHSKNKREED